MATRDVTLQYLATAKIGGKGQLILPKRFRKELRLSTGAPLAILRLGDGLVLLPEQRRFEELCEKISSALSRIGVTEDEVLASLPETRKREFARRYKSLAPGRTRKASPQRRSGRGK
jgi:AbrB family looped-hinge helix DNA binding protein